MLFYFKKEAGGAQYCLLLLMVFCLLLQVGCGKKEVAFQRVSGSMQPEGHSLQSYGNSSDASLQGGDLNGGSFAEGGFESLDGTGSYGFSADPESEQFKARYGRSTPPLTPVYFEFDSATISPDQYQDLDAGGKYLLENSSAYLVIEGNCDARGTAEYNLALGELRARSVKKHLVALGVAQERVETISFGSERPLYHGSTEADWAMNRRADLVLP